MTNPVVVIQARLGSTRLPKKVIAELHGATVLSHIYRRCLCSEYEVVIAVPTDEIDEMSKASNIAKSVFHGGSERDLIQRLYDAAKGKDATHLIRVTADCPFVDPFLIRHMVGVSLRENQPIVTNTYPPRTFPDGLDLEVYRMDFMESALREVEDHEDFYTWFMKNLGEHAFHRLILEESLGNIRLTLDTKEDLDYVRDVYELIGNDIFPSSHLLNLLEETNRVWRTSGETDENVERSGAQNRSNLRCRANSIIGGIIRSHKERHATSKTLPGDQASEDSGGRIIIP